MHSKWHRPQLPGFETRPVGDVLRKKEMAAFCYKQTNQMAHVFDNGRRPKAVTRKFLQIFAIPDRTSASRNLSAVTILKSKINILYIGNCPEHDVRWDVLAESCEEPLRSDTPNVFAVCRLLV